MMEEIKKMVDSIKTYPEVVAIILYGSHAKNKLSLYLILISRS